MLGFSWTFEYEAELTGDQIRSEQPCPGVVVFVFASGCRLRTSSRPCEQWSSLRERTASGDLSRTGAPGCRAGTWSLRSGQPRSVSGPLRSEFTRPCAQLRSPTTTGTNGAGPWGVYGRCDPCSRSPRIGELRRETLPRPTNLPTCPSLCPAGRRPPGDTRWRPSRGTALRKERPVLQRSGLAVTEEWRPGRRRAT